VFLPVPSKISHWMDNEHQDTVPFLENCADVDKRGTRLPEAKGFGKSTVVRKWQRYMDKVKKWEDSRLPLVGEWMR
jgi:hypothetical protein